MFSKLQKPFKHSKFGISSQTNMLNSLDFYLWKYLILKSNILTSNFSITKIYFDMRSFYTDFYTVLHYILIKNRQKLKNCFWENFKEAFGESFSQKFGLVTLGPQTCGAKCKKSFTLQVGSKSCPIFLEGYPRVVHPDFTTGS